MNVPHEPGSPGTTTVEVAWQAGALLGEGPIWVASEEALYFVDIKDGGIYRWHPRTGAGARFETGGAPSFIVTSADGGLLVGSHHAVHRFREGKLASVFIEIPMPAGNRTNDATVDDGGRLWFGCMDEAESEPLGTIWCLDRCKLRRTQERAVITNGPAVDDERELLYHVDSTNHTIFRSRIDADGALRNRLPFLQLTAADGYPDGIVVDSEGCLWVALWDGWSVRRYSPAGALLQTVSFPCARVTKLAFGGPDLKTAFVTTAKFGLTPEQCAAQPLAGSLFQFDAPAPGRAVPPVRLA